jgi:hypothetical protein
MKKPGPIFKKTRTVGGPACESKDRSAFLAKTLSQGWVDMFDSGRLDLSRRSDDGRPTATQHGGSAPVKEPRRCETWVLWRPRFLINPNSRATQLTVVKSRSTWALTPKNSLTYSSDPLWLVNTLVGPTHGQRLGQTTFTPNVHRCLPELLPRSPKFT